MALARPAVLALVLLNICAATAQTPPALLCEGRALLPVRPVAEWLGATLDYDQATGETSVALNRRFVIFKPYRPLATVDGRNVKVQPAPLAVAGVTWAPARLLADGLGLKIVWHEATRLVQVFEPGGDRSLDLSVTSQVDSTTASLSGGKAPETVYHLSLLDGVPDDADVSPVARVWVVRDRRVLTEFEPQGGLHALPRDSARVRRPLLTRDLTGSGRQTVIARFATADGRTDVYLLGWDKGGDGFVNLLGNGAEHFTLTRRGDLTVADNGPKKPMSLLVYDAYAENPEPKEGSLWYSVWYGLQESGKFAATLSHQTETRHKLPKPALAEMGINLGGK